MPFREDLFPNYNWSNLWELNLIGCSIDDYKFSKLVEGTSHAYPNVVALYLSTVFASILGFNHIRTVTEKML